MTRKTSRGNQARRVDHPADDRKEVVGVALGDVAVKVQHFGAVVVS